MRSQAEQEARRSIAESIKMARLMAGRIETDLQMATACATAFGELHTLRKFCPSEQYNRLASRMAGEEIGYV